MSKTRAGAERKLWLIAACVAWAALYPSNLEAKCQPGKALAPGDHVFNLDLGGDSRTFTLHVPSTYDGRTPVPLVFDLHGFSSTGPSQLSISGFVTVSDMNNFMVVAPTGYMNSWNGDIAYGAAQTAKLDDVGLMRAIVKYIAGIANINHGKVYSTGLSNGAAMSNTLGCQGADTFAGIAPVADPLDIGLDTCMPAHPIAVLGFHGYSDDLVPYEGGAGSGPSLPTPFPSIPDTLKNWAKIMQCTGTPEVIPFQGTNKCEIYRECAGEAQVGYCSLEGGHMLYSQTGLNIADYAWKFFDKFSLPLPDADGDHIGDDDDNCVHVANADQADTNGNCIGDVCECSTPVDCDDHSFCNGPEACTNGVCGPGAAPCQASQTCDESQRQCVDASTKPDAGAPAGDGAGGANAGQAGGSPSGSAGTEVATGPVVVGTPAAPSPALSLGASGASANAGTSGSPAAVSSNVVQPAQSETQSGCGCHTLGNARGSATQRLSAVFLLVAGLFLTRWRRSHHKATATRGVRRRVCLTRIGGSEP